MPETKVGLYDLDDFERLMTGGPLAVFLKGHLWLETVLNDFLEAAAQDAKPLKQMGFAAKVNVCEAFGLVPPPLCKAFREINRRRNLLAHELHASFGDDSLAEMLAHSAPQSRASYEAMLNHLPGDMDSPEGRLTFWYFAVIMDAGYSLLLRRWHDEHQSEHAAFAAIRLIEEKLGGRIRSDEEVRKEVNLPDPPDPRDVWYRGNRG
ncbi:hypothetical protein [Pseudarthrobacter oxydans]|uniref:hypothetical protein n=1 Tax=Pseudarthrobacter oxydans TaxID=1671 RepID=UPI00381F6E97